MNKTLQNALIALYGSLGGNSANLPNVESIGALICEIAKLNLGAAISGASVKELPPLPDDDGTYSLQLVIDEGEATLSWEAVE